MITNSGVTIWHEVGYDKETRMDAPPVRQFFPTASVQKDIKATVDNGLKTADVVKIRIPGDISVLIKNGDRVMLGEHTEPEAPEDAFVVKGFADNRKGSPRVWHWKVICG